jgi:protein O-mannosyl-transferase
MSTKSNQDSNGHDKAWATYIIVALGLITLACFWKLTNAEFINYDDPDFVTANPRVLDGLSWAGLKWAFTSFYIYYQPLTWISYMTDVSLYGLSSSGFHFTNLLLHTSNTLLLFYVLYRMTHSLWRCAFVAALFAVHPFHVETVAWIAERKGLLSTFFWLLAIWAYTRYVNRPDARRYVLVLACFAAGLLSKSMVITLPVVLLLLDYWPLRRIKTIAPPEGPETNHAVRPIDWKRALVEKIPLFVLSALSALITVVAQRGMGAVLGISQVSLPNRLAHTLVSYVVYLQKAFWPVDFAVFYPHPGTWPLATVLLSVAILVLLSACAFYARRRHPWFAVGWIFYLVALFPVCGLFQTGEQGFADRYTYIPLSGIFLMVSWGLGEVTRILKIPSAIPGAVGFALVAVCLFLTSHQVGYWQNSKALFQHANAAIPGNYLAQTVLGNLLTQEGRPQEALPFFETALKQQPFYYDTHSSYGSALLSLTDYSNASVHFEAALRVKPNDPQALLNYAAACQLGGDLAKAEGAYKELLKLQPSSMEGHFNLANVLLQQKRPGEALPHFEEVIQSNPDFAEALNSAAWIMATAPQTEIRDKSKALAWASKAASLTGNQQPRFLRTVAAAQAENGQLSQAIQTCDGALEKAESSGEKDLSAKLHKMLEEFKAGRAYRE